MELSPSTSFSAKINKSLFGRETYVTESGCKVTVKAGTGNISVGEDGVINVTDAEKLRVYDSKGDDKIRVTKSDVDMVRAGRGNDYILLDQCNFRDYNMFKGGSTIMTYGNKKGCSTIMINGDFRGNLQAQQGAGRGYGDDKDAHKDNIIITGNNYGHINVDTHDKVAIKGSEKGHITNTTTYVMYC